jgi:hypothetical protein
MGTPAPAVSATLMLLSESPPVMSISLSFFIRRTSMSLFSSDSRRWMLYWISFLFWALLFAVSWAIFCMSVSIAACCARIRGWRSRYRCRRAESSISAAVSSAFSPSSAEAFDVEARSLPPGAVSSAVPLGMSTFSSRR